LTDAHFRQNPNGAAWGKFSTALLDYFRGFRCLPHCWLAAVLAPAAYTWRGGGAGGVSGTASGAFTLCGARRGNCWLDLGAKSGHVVQEFAPKRREARKRSKGFPEIPSGQASMVTVLLVIHIMAAFSMIVLILLQRSEGGALGMGGGGGGFVTGRAAANLLTKMTATLAAVFFATSLGLGIMGHRTGPVSAVGLPAQTAPASAPGENVPQSLPDISIRTQKPAAPSAPAVPALPQPK
jgi:preprotein translocase subunit SecG